MAGSWWRRQLGEYDGRLMVSETNRNGVTFYWLYDGRGSSARCLRTWGVDGADVIRQALDAGLVDELTIVVSPVVLGGGKRLFEGFTRSLELEHLGVRQSRYATFIDYRIRG